MKSGLHCFLGRRVIKYIIKLILQLKELYIVLLVTFCHDKSLALHKL